MKKGWTKNRGLGGNNKDEKHQGQWPDNHNNNNNGTAGVEVRSWGITLALQRRQRVIGQRLTSLVCVYGWPTAAKARLDTLETSWHATQYVSTHTTPQCNATQIVVRRSSSSSYMSINDNQLIAMGNEALQRHSSKNCIRLSASAGGTTGICVKLAIAR